MIISPNPFAHDELIARMHAIMAPLPRSFRSPSLSVGKPGCQYGPTRTCEIDGNRSFRLTPVKEYQMLELTALTTGKTVTKQMFFDHIYGGKDEPDMKILDVFMCKMRLKLEAACPDGGQSH